MGNIIYEILNGELPITVNLFNDFTGYTNIHNDYGVYEFNNVITGYTYNFNVIDSYNCNLTKIIYPCTCSEGYSSVMGICQKIETTEATQPTIPTSYIKTPYFNYSYLGTLILSDYNYNGTGTIYKRLTTDFWCNSQLSVNKGPLNRTGVWSSNGGDTNVGFTINVNILFNKVYYIGIGCDNYTKIKVNGNTVIQQDVYTIRTDISRQGYPAYGGDTNAFLYWIIYPISLQFGMNIIEVIGGNYGGPAAVGCEIYDINPNDFANINSYSDLGNKLLFSSKDMIGQIIDSGYTCPVGYSLVKDNYNNYYCQKISYKNCGEL
jgi:hypothetical protein